MPRFERGQFENYLRELILDVISERFSNQENTSEDTVDFSGNQGRGRRASMGKSGRTKGSVTDPNRDRRLKRNRGKPAQQEQ